MQKNKLGWVALGGVFLTFGFGCSALLGDFTVGGAGPAGGDGGPSTDGNVEGATDAQPAPRPLACDALRDKTNTLVYTAPAGSNISDQLSVVRATPNKTRIIFAEYIVSGPGVLRVLTVDPSDSGGGNPKVPKVGQISSISNASEARKMPLSVELTVQSSSSASSLGTMQIPDSYDGTGEVPTTYTAMVDLSVFPFIATQNQRFQARAVPMAAAGDYFFAFSAQAFGNVDQSPAGPAELWVGRRTATSPAAGIFPKRLNTAPDLETRLDPSAVVMDAQQANIFLPGVFEGTAAKARPPAMFTVLDNGQPPSPLPAPRPLGPTGSPYVLLPSVGPAATGGNFNFAFFTLDLTAGLEVHTGQVIPSDLRSVTVASPQLKTAVHFDQLADMPIGESGRFYGDDFITVGSTGNVTGGTGVNFLWVDAQGNLRARTAAGKPLLSDRPNLDRVAVGQPELIGTLLARFDLVWTEKTGSGATASMQVFFNQVVCH